MKFKKKIISEVCKCCYCCYFNYYVFTANVCPDGYDVQFFNSTHQYLRATISPNTYFVNIEDAFLGTGYFWDIC